MNHFLNANFSLFTLVSSSTFYQDELCFSKEKSVPKTKIWINTCNTFFLQFFLPTLHNTYTFIVVCFVEKIKNDNSKQQKHTATPTVFFAIVTL